MPPPPPLFPAPLTSSPFAISRLSDFLRIPPGTASEVNVGVTRRSGYDFNQKC